MKFKVGQKVKLINAIGSGIPVRFNNKVATFIRCVYGTTCIIKFSEESSSWLAKYSHIKSLNEEPNGQLLFGFMCE